MFFLDGAVLVERCGRRKSVSIGSNEGKFVRRRNGTVISLEFIRTKSGL